jgi:hypothetical protein
MDEWWQWVSWGVGILGALIGVCGYLRARRTDKRLRRADEVSPWAEAEHHSGDLFMVKNVSARDVIVTGLTAHPPEKAELLESRQTYPFRVGAGDSLDALVHARYMWQRPDVVISWHFVGSREPRSSRRIVPPAVA